jgi:hypothetical protein
VDIQSAAYSAVVASDGRIDEKQEGGRRFCSGSRLRVVEISRKNSPGGAHSGSLAFVARGLRVKSTIQKAESSREIDSCVTVSMRSRSMLHP